MKETAIGFIAGVVVGAGISFMFDPTLTDFTFGTLAFSLIGASIGAIQAFGRWLEAKRQTAG